jgi:hypothetical protein
VYTVTSATLAPSILEGVPHSYVVEPVGLIPVLDHKGFALAGTKATSEYQLVGVLVDACSVNGCEALRMNMISTASPAEPVLPVLLTEYVILCTIGVRAVLLESYIVTVTSVYATSADIAVGAGMLAFVLAATVTPVVANVTLNVFAPPVAL